jgi:outer membrane protein assembly factor BamA
MFHQIGTRVGQGVPTGDVQFGGTGAIFVNYFPLPGPFVFSTRIVLDFLYGNPAFYDLYNAGPFNTWEMPGGGSGVRGVPLGRYSGLVKAVGNAELRFMHAHFKVLGQKFKLGNAGFFDTGRVWDDYTFASPRDGSGLGLKWGAGVGTYIQWGEAAVFRIDFAYSPDAVAESRSFPFGLYVADSVAF